MWLLYRVLILTAFLASMTSAHAEVTITSTNNQPTTQTQPVLAAPPASALTTNNNQQIPQQFSASPQIAPAPVIQPLLSPRDQAAQANRLAAELAAQQGATTTNAANNNTAPAMMPVPQQQIMPQQQQMPMMAAPQQQQAIITAPPATASTTPAITENNTAKAAEATPIQATTAQGFAPSGSQTTIPTATGIVPVTNAGIDMNLTPSTVSGGVDPDYTNANGVDAVPYEVQLQQRTQELQQQARGIAFEQAKKSILPLETYEIRDVLGRLKDTQEAIQTPVRPAPKPGNIIRTVSTDPGVKPQTIHLAAGNVTTLNIIDITGEPWPIMDIGFGGPFDIKAPEPGGHVVRITPLKDFAHGNMVIRLLKMTTPITFSLESGDSTVDYRFDARLPEYGPNAKTPVIDKGIGMMAGDKVTTSFLEGVAPTGAEKIIVDGTDGRTSAYRYSNALYVRTPLSLLSPAWQGSATSSDGMNVYVLEDTPVLLLSDKGSLVRAHLGEKAATTMKE